MWYRIKVPVVVTANTLEGQEGMSWPRATQQALHHGKGRHCRQPSSQPIPYRTMLVQRLKLVSGAEAGYEDLTRMPVAGTTRG